jgi:DNA-binding MarR family transcriptional regulator
MVTSITAVGIVNLLPLAVLRLTAAGDALHSGRDLTSALRSILVSVGAHGPKTVSEMAAVRLVSRQYLQRAVDELLERGLLTTRDNPRHRRSPLIALTTRGAKMVDAIAKAEAPHIVRLVAGITKADLATTARVLGIICERLSAESVAELEKGELPGGAQ